MFVARDEELSLLDSMYAKGEFQMAVVYGRRRVGKTALLEQLSREKLCLFFTAREQSSKGNLADFSAQIARTFNLSSSLSAFESWATALSFVAENAQELEKPLLFVFDEFPYAAATEPALPSTLQVAIDHEFMKTNMLLILCGSNEGFMESKVLGRKSPLYGRRNAQIRLKPFDCFDAAKMLPHLKFDELLRYYSTFGGTPYYLAQIDAAQTYEENVKRLFFSMYGMLYEEPLLFLRQELREPALYNSILGAIASGKTKPKQIAESAGLQISSIAKYLKTLEALDIIEKIVPFGGNPLKSRKGIYRIKDPFFAYWHRFVGPCVGAIEGGAGARAASANAFGEALFTYEGMQFENVCTQWLVRENRAGALGFLANTFGKWWGADPKSRTQVDIDVIAANKQSGNILFCECKWRNSFDETKAIKNLEQRSSLIEGYKHKQFILFTKRSVSAETQKKLSERSDFKVVAGF